MRRKTKTDDIAIFSFSTGKALCYFAVRKHFTENITFVGKGAKRVI